MVEMEKDAKKSYSGCIQPRGPARKLRQRPWTLGYGFVWGVNKYI